MTSPSSGYDVEFEWHHAHGHLARLVIDRPERGVVLDLGCGYAPHAEVLRDAGFTYVGCDVDRDAIDALRSRGFAGCALDLSDAGDLARALSAAVDDLRPDGDAEIAAVIALDTIEHLVRPDLTLAAIAEWMRSRSVPILGLSVPNATHRDVAFKLLGARWDVTPTGLLDVTHLRFFADASLSALLTSVGCVEIARHDVDAPVSDQRWPVDHPLLSADTAVGALLRQIRHRADDHATTHQFVRLYAPDTALDPHPTLTVERPAGTAEAALSVLVHPDADPAAVRERLAGQTSPPYEVLERASAELTVGAALAEMADRAIGTHVVVVDRWQRPEPGWVDQFLAAATAHPGAVLRCRPSPAQLHHGPEWAWPDRFDLVDHLVGDATPSGAVAFPLETLRSLRASFGDGHELSVVHELLVDIGPLCGVRDTQVPALVAAPGWRRSGVDDALAARCDRLDAGAVLLGPGGVGASVARQRRLTDAARTEADLRARLDELAADNDWLNDQLRSTPVRVVRRLTRRRR